MKSEEADYRERYSRQMLFMPLGQEGQERLRASRAVIVGCGALGTAVANSLSRAGIGALRLIDRDNIELSNLPRQLLFTEEDIGRPKAEAAAAHLLDINSALRVESLVTEFSPQTAEALIAGADVVVDAVDNFATRFLINDACISAGIPWVYGGVLGSRGYSLTIMPGRPPCLRCLMPEAPLPGSYPTCHQEGVLNMVTGVIGSVEAMEAVKVIAGAEIKPTLLYIDLWERDFRLIDVSGSAREDCPVCGTAVS